MIEVNGCGDISIEGVDEGSHRRRLLAVERVDTGGESFRFTERVLRTLITEGEGDVGRLLRTERRSSVSSSSSSSARVLFRPRSLVFPFDRGTASSSRKQPFNSHEVSLSS